MTSEVTESTDSLASLVMIAVNASKAKKPQHKRGQVPVMSDVSLVVDEGEAIGILGTPADGTTLLLEAAAGLALPQAGKVYVRHKSALLAAGNAFDLDETLRFNVERIAMTLELNGSRLKVAVRDALTNAGMEDQADTVCADLEALDIERTRLAAVLQAGPSLLLVDEPPARGRALLGVMGKEGLARHLELGGSLVLAGSSPEVMRRLCSRIIWLRKGKIIMDGPSSSVTKDFQRISNASDDKDKVGALYRRYARRYSGLKVIAQTSGRRSQGKP